MRALQSGPARGVEMEWLVLVAAIIAGGVLGGTVTEGFVARSLRVPIGAFLAGMDLRSSRFNCSMLPEAVDLLGLQSLDKFIMNRITLGIMMFVAVIGGISAGSVLAQ
jgi:hypothetical protein